jgi:hypothetical protein
MQNFLKFQNGRLGGRYVTSKRDFYVLTSVSDLDPALKLLDLGLLPQHLPGVGLNAALVLLHLPAWQTL